MYSLHEGSGLFLLAVLAGLQIAAEGRVTPPCRPGFSEDVYKVVMPDIVEKGHPLFNGSLQLRGVCRWVSNGILKEAFIAVLQNPDGPGYSWGHSDVFKGPQCLVRHDPARPSPVNWAKCSATYSTLSPALRLVMRLVGVSWWTVDE
ncbi:hypothetical protein NQZ68_001552 [Dissostichus eleginoides]|nr:hypothetical protein NQZ68_001552 [Dissostichus eleginoides]